MGQLAVLICNGPTGAGYQPPADAFSVTINGGFREHRADAAFTVDCPPGVKAAWGQFTGIRVMAAHNCLYPFKPFEAFECEQWVRKYHTSTVCAMLWILSKGFRRLLLVGCDSLLGLQDKAGGYTQNGHKEFMDLLAPRFTDGLDVLVDGKPVAWATLRESLGPWPAVTPAARTEKAAKKEAQKLAEASPLPTCKIPQTMVEFDVSPKCTRTCSFCSPGIPKNRRKLRVSLSIKNHNRVIDDLAAAGFDRPDRWLCYCGHGEPACNGSLVPMLRYARAKLPRARMALYTNGDKLTVDLCCKLEALDLDTLIWDCYDNQSATTVPGIIRASSLDIARVRVNDYRKGFSGASSRAGTVRESKAAEWAGRPCGMPDGKLFFTDDNAGKGKTRWLLCCEDYARETSWPGELTPEELNADPKFASILAKLKAGKRDCCATCAKCDRDGGHPSGFGHVPALADSPLWTEYQPAPPRVDGYRLVVLLANAKWAEHARVLLKAIDRVSSMSGKTLLVWNDTVKMPEDFRGENRVCWEYKEPLGWCGISRGLARAYRYCIDSGYRWMIKLDTDTAILCRGWDARICAECPDGAIAGTYMDAVFTGQTTAPLDQEPGLFVKQLAEECRWARGLVRSGRRRYDHIQGGCYCISTDALKRIDEIVGVDAADQEDVPEGLRIGEDVYIDSKAKLCCVPQIDSHRMRIWFREPGKDAFAMTAIRHLRDTRAACVAHPVKDLSMLRTLAEEIR